MYYIAKIAQATGLGIILIGFVKDFPHLMNPRLLLVGVIVFLLGWIIERYMLIK